MSYRVSDSRPLCGALALTTRSRGSGVRSAGRCRDPLEARVHAGVGFLLLLMAALLVGCETGTEPSEVGRVLLAEVDPNLTVGGAVQLTATVVSTNGSVLPGHPVTWSSSDRAVASVSTRGLVTALAAGTATIRAASEGKSALLTVQVASPCRVAGVGSISLGQSRTGTLDASDCAFLHGVSADGYQLSLPATTGILVELASTAFDALIVITDANMNVLWWDDDGGPGLDSRLERRVPAGDYVIWATGFGQPSGGAYRLSATQVEIPLCPVVGDVGIGQAVGGTISETDCAGDRGYSDPWRLSVGSETTLRIDLTSGDFDTYLIVENVEGTLMAEDDDSGQELNSRLEYRFAAGEYRVVATTWAPGHIGAYQLSAQATGGLGSASLRRAPADVEADWLKGGRKP